MNRKSCFGCIGLLLAAFTVPALAQTWQLTSGSGSFQSPSNWSPAEVPGVGDAAVFSVPGESTVTFAASAQNASATFGAASGIDVALDVGASTWSLNDLIYNNPATVRLNSGTLQVANGVTTLRGMILNGGSANFPGGLRAGAYQVNRLEIHGGSHACNGMTLYENANETDGFEMRMSGGTLANTGKMTLYGADVNLEGGDVTFNELNFYGSGPSSITVHTNASLIGTGLTPDLYMGRNAGTLSTLNIHGGVVSNVYLMAMGVTDGTGVIGPSTSVVHLVDGLLQMGGGGTLTHQAIDLGWEDNSVAILNQYGGAMTLSGELNFSRQDAVNTRSELNLHGGTLTTPYNWRVGYNAGSHGRIVKTGGHLEHTGNGVIVGYSSTGTVHGVNASEMRIEGGTMALKTGLGLFFSWAAGTYGYGEFSGGTNDMGNKPITIGRNGGTGFMRMTGGWVTNVSSVVLGNEATSFGRLELSGGVLGLLGGVTSSSTGVDSSVVLLDGGILRHDGSSSQASLINASVQRVALTTNGAVVQLQGYECTIPAKLVNETGHAGAFTKLGPTRLTLSSPDSAFTGRITVAEGQLRVTGGVYLTGGVVVEDGAWLNLYDSSSAYATIHDARTASGTISRIDGTMTLAPAGALTCGDGAVVGGGGTLTGGLVVEAGGALGADKDGTGRALDVTGAVDFAAGAGVALTGYVSEALETPVAVLNAAGGIAVAAPLPVSLDGVVQPSLRADLNAEGTTLLVRFQPIGTVLCVR